MPSQTTQVYAWDGQLVAEGKHKQCAGLRWLADGRLLSWGWDKKVREFAPG